MPRSTRRVSSQSDAFIQRAPLVGAALALLVVLTACGASITPMQPRAPSPIPEASAVGESRSTPSNVARMSDADYFDAFPLMVPVLGVDPRKIPDTFHAARGRRTHRATDILAPKGTEVVAASDGKILRLSENRLGGLTIYMLDTNARFLYYYAHLNGYADHLAAGQVVLQGELLGYVGMTGNAPVPHLHFQAMRWDSKRRDYWNSDPVDILPYLKLPAESRDVSLRH